MRAIGWPMCERHSRCQRRVTDAKLDDFLLSALMNAVGENRPDLANNLTHDEKVEAIATYLQTVTLSAGNNGKLILSEEALCAALGSEKKCIESRASRTYGKKFKFSQFFSIKQLKVTKVSFHDHTRTKHSLFLS